MNYLIILFGLFVIAMALVMLVSPSTFVAWARRLAGTKLMYGLAVGGRLVLGIVLILYADESKFPLALKIFGGLAIAAAAVLAALTRDRFQRLVTWMIDRFGGYAPPMAILALLFGAFLIYAVI